MDFMKRLFAGMVLLTTLAWAADYKVAKVLDVHDASSLAEAAVSNHPVSAQAGGGVTTSIPSQYLRCEITVALEGTSYTAIYREDPHFKITDFNPGDPVQVRVEGKKLVRETAGWERDEVQDHEAGPGRDHGIEVSDNPKIKAHLCAWRRGGLSCS